MIGLPEASRIWSSRNWEKSPLRRAAVGTEARTKRFDRSKVPSQSAKKNSLFFLMGPPMLPPSMFRMFFGFLLTPERFSSQMKARVALLLW